MRIPLPVNYGAMPGGYFNPARVSNAQAAFAPMQAYGNALLPMEQAQFMPYQIQAQMLSNPLLWMASQGNPGMMNSMIQNLTGSMPKMNMMTNMPMAGAGGGILGAILGHYVGNGGAAAPAAASQMASALPASMMPLVQNAGITNASPLTGQPGWYMGYQNGNPIKFRMQP